MKHTSPLESPKNVFNQPTKGSGIPILRPNPNVIRNLNVNFEDLMPPISDPASPNFQKMNDLLKSPNFQGSKPTSLVLPEYSQNSWIIPLQENGLETSMPFEDLIGQLESPKLSDKMQLIFHSNVNLSESIMKNTFRAVDESRVKLEDKDLQVELEISELKLHHLEKRLEGCLASSKNTLALNAQLSQNVSRMVSPVKASHGVLTSNIKTRSNSRMNTPRIQEDSPSPMTSQLNENRNEALSVGKNRNKSMTQRIGDAQGESGNNVRFKDLVEIEREKASPVEKRVKSVSVSVPEPNYRLKDSIISEAYQKLNSYLGTGEIKTPEIPPQQEEKYEEEIEVEGVKMQSADSPLKSTEQIMSNNVTFYTNNLVGVDGEEQTKNLTRLQSNEYLSEDQEPLQKQNYLFSSKPRETTSVPPTEPKANTLPREVSLVDADGKERIFILKPKESLNIERLESISIVPLGNKAFNLKKAKIRSQLSSFQGSETEECSQIKENLRHIQNDQTMAATQSRGSLFDNSNVASMNLDKQEHKLSMFGGQAGNQESMMMRSNSIEDQKDAYLNHLKLQILNHPKCQKFFAADTLSGSARGRSVDTSSKENDGMEFYFKQKIQDFREFLNEFERILPTEPSLSPAKDSTRIKRVKQLKSWDTVSKEQTTVESKTVENTPRGLLNENQEYIKEKYHNNMKKPVNVIEGLHEQTPQNYHIFANYKPNQFESNEFQPQRLFKEKLESPVSATSKMSFITKPGFNVPLKKKVKTVKPGDQTQISTKAIKLNKGNQSIAVTPVSNAEKKKTHDKSASLKSFSQQMKTKKSPKGLENNEAVEIKKKREKNSKSIVEVISLGKLPTRANSVFVQK